MKLNIPLLKEICETAGAPGYEQRIREIVLREVKSLADDVSVDNMGNVTAIKKGREKKPPVNRRLYSMFERNGRYV